MSTWPEGRFQAGEKWVLCDRCGFYYPASSMRKQQGLNVCTHTPCLDEENPRDPSVTK
jgi:hypothetical protein